MGALYDAKRMLDEEAQFHLAGIVINLLQAHDVDASELVTDIFRYVSPQRDHWNTEVQCWMDARSKERRQIDGEEGV